MLNAWNADAELNPVQGGREMLGSILLAALMRLRPMMLILKFYAGVRGNSMRKVLVVSCWSAELLNCELIILYSVDIDMEDACQPGRMWCWSWT